MHKTTIFVVQRRREKSLAEQSALEAFITEAVKRQEDAEKVCFVDEPIGFNLERFMAPNINHQPKVKG